MAARRDEIVRTWWLLIAAVAAGIAVFAWGTYRR